DAGAPGAARGLVGAAVHAQPPHAGRPPPRRGDRRRPARPHRPRTGPRDRRRAHRARDPVPDGPRPGRRRLLARPARRRDARPPLTDGRSHGPRQAPLPIHPRHPARRGGVPAGAARGDAAHRRGRLGSRGLRARRHPPRRHRAAQRGRGEDGRHPAVPRRHRARARGGAAARLDRPGRRDPRGDRRSRRPHVRRRARRRDRGRPSRAVPGGRHGPRAAGDRPGAGGGRRDRAPRRKARGTAELGGGDRRGQRALRRAVRRLGVAVPPRGARRRPPPRGRGL
ncbi:MAG: hypothetical protein AVDCRST_MAG13-142, partial [uncultured Solirubrobacteraceae bacterium]